MAGFALFDALPDFGAPRRPPRVVEESRPAVAAAVHEPPPVETFTREQVEIAAADARAEVEERLRAAHEAEMAAAATRHAAELDALRAELGAQAGALVAQRFAELESNLSAATNAVVARILGVALTEQVTRDAVDQLARAVNGALTDRDAVRLRIKGPLSLYEALRPALGAHAERTDFAEATSLDISVAVESALFETRISEWSSALSEALAGGQP
ncbi:MAG: hypothetical protein KF849_11720 [Rhizobiaceae bacterium]|nr:hypothetical protein [Rhizobiaceae bacterium]